MNMSCGRGASWSVHLCIHTYVKDRAVKVKVKVCGDAKYKQRTAL